MTREERTKMLVEKNMLILIPMTYYSLIDAWEVKYIMNSIMLEILSYFQEEFSFKELGK